MQQYQQFLQHILENGIRKEDRTGTGTISVFGYQMRFNLNEGFPLVTTKKLHVKSIIHELLWFIAGDTNIQYLCKNACNIWNDWPFAKYQKSSDYQGETMKEFATKIANNDAFAKQHGELGPVYGSQWRSWPLPDGGHINQIQQLLDQIKNNPDSRRLIVSAWNVADIPRMKLPPCHAFFQFYVADGRLSCQLYQRSADIFLGVPFNIASYALLTHMMAQQTGLEVGDFIWTGGDCHLYSNHLEQVDLQLSRTPYPLPQLKIHRKPDSIFDYRFEDFEILNYEFHPHIKAPVAV